MSKVHIDVLKPWIKQKITELMGFEDDMTIEYVHSMLSFEKTE